MKRLLILAFLALPLAACGESTPPAPKSTPSPKGAKVFFIEPKNGAEVTSPVTVKFGIEGMEVAPAGTEKPNSGHHHVLIDTRLAENYQGPLPMDDSHKHFGKGQTEAALELRPGKHTLQMVLGDHNHVPHDPPVVSEVISVTVK
jgi:hypothetical protein